MKERMQKISNYMDSYLGNDRVELERYQGVQTFIGITENNLMEVPLERENLLAQILSSSNLNLAFKKVKANKGSYGIDKMSTENLLVWLRDNKESLTHSLENGK